MITPQNLVRHELIGLEVLVEKSTNKSLEGLSGTVLDETRQTLTIKTGKKGGNRQSLFHASTEKKIPKDICTFIFILSGNQKVRVDGNILVSRPEDRIKKKLRKW